VVDFACPAAKLVVELDGEQHTIQSEADRARSLAISRRGYRIIRFWNNGIMENFNGVREVILSELSISLSAPGGGAGVSQHKP
jgi:very-short-patch-repair endonuclease